MVFACGTFCKKRPCDQTVLGLFGFTHSSIIDHSRNEVPPVVSHIRIGVTVVAMHGKLVLEKMIDKSTSSKLWLVWAGA